MPDVMDCPTCAAAEATARDRPGEVRRCAACGAAFHVARRPQRRPRARPLAPVDPPPERCRLEPPASYSARLDMAAVARHPYQRAASFEAGRATPATDPDPQALADAENAARLRVALHDETPEARERRQERDVYRARAARERLAWLAAPAHAERVPWPSSRAPAWTTRVVPHPHGRRWAALLWFWFGELSEGRRAWPGAVDDLVQRFGRRGAGGELERYRAAWVARHPGVKTALVDALVPRAYAAALIEAATQAYERGAFGAVVPGDETPPAHPLAESKLGPLDSGQ